MRSTHSVVALIDVGTHGNALVIPVSITAERSVDGVRMDVNAISSAYERNVSALVKEAVAQFNTGDNSVFYVKKEAADLLGAGVRFPEQLKAAASYDGIVRKFDPKINMSIENVTQSQQFKRWFGDWQNKPETASIKEQVENSREALNAMDLVARASVPTNLKTKDSAAAWAAERLKSTGYRVDRQGYGEIYFSKKDMDKGLRYADTAEEKAALAVLPQVLKRGIEIGDHTNHKNRVKQTVTFAARQEILKPATGSKGRLKPLHSLQDRHLSSIRNSFLHDKRGRYAIILLCKSK